MRDEARADALLSTVEESSRGRLTIFLGAAPGVGKTYSMLQAAKEQLTAGRRVLIGVVETHGRQDTAALARGMERIPCDIHEYRRKSLAEFSLDGALEARPDLLLLDELAHTNVPGSRHQKRYQDVEELLKAGIDVFTTLNVQHLASLHDTVKQLTGVDVREQVPDTLLELAFEIKLVDLPVRELLGRLEAGKVYVPHQARAAMSSFFTHGNLSALRELALHTAAQCVDRQTQLLRTAKGDNQAAIVPHLLVCIESLEESEAMIRRGHQFARLRHLSWSVVAFGKEARASEAAGALQLARDLGADVEILYDSDRPRAVREVARRRKVTALMVANRAARWWRKGIGQQLQGVDEGWNLILVPAPKPGRRRARRDERGDLKDYLQALVVMAIASVIAFPLSHWLSLSDLSMVYQVGVLVVAVRTRVRATLFAAVVAFLCFNFFFTAPYFQFFIEHRSDTITALVFLLFALFTGHLASRLRKQVLYLRRSNHFATSLLEFSRRLSGQLTHHEFLEEGGRQLSQALGLDVLVMGKDPDQGLTTISRSSPGAGVTVKEQTAANWCLSNGEAAGFSTNTLNSCDWLFLPLKLNDGQVHQVVGIRGDESLQSSQRRNQLDAWLEVWRQALSQSELREALAEERLKSETEQLRAVLLSSISHDLRTPLTTLIGSTDSWLRYHTQLSQAEQLSLIEGVATEGKRLHRYVTHLLDMTRIGQGELTLNRQPVEVEQLLSNVIGRLETELKPFELVTHVDEGIPRLNVHASLLEQSLLNVLDNACQWTKLDGRIGINVRKLKDKLKIEIYDQGPGIDPNLRWQIFEPFFTTRKRDRGPGGSGLGLAIAKGMIQAHGGSIKALACTEEEGYATCIQIQLPLDQNSAESE
ncbi:DUF4118 domain-containing protein [Dongshaea marina]|uniref:DUF4118 domain-containing protein n=1 Tax=Dongshaea marina TaxID=2047966 RepID=UPI000D3E1AC6|nr:DUF4118 domain-containing protein [Dongshaea marina]